MFATALLMLVAAKNPGTPVEYRPGGAAVRPVWDKFYAGDHEPELPLPLIAAGKTMTPFICEAVRHTDMKLRRYAISALGYLHDPRALPTLHGILASKREIYYFRGDALQAIYLIDHALAKALAHKYRDEHEYLAMVAKAIDEDAAWLSETPRDDSAP